MHTGQYYYDQMPATVQRKFLLNVERSNIYTIDEVMRSEYMSHKLFILCPFNQFNSPEGKEYWHDIADQNYSVEPEPRFKTWFNQNVGNIVIALAGLALSLCLVMALLIEKHNEERKQWKAADQHKDSVNLINRANHIVDSTNAANALYYGGNKSKFKGSIILDSANKWMDKVMDENKVGE